MRRAAQVWGRLLFAAAVLGPARCVLNSSWWPCEQVTLQPDVQIQQMLGDWYLVEDISQFGSSSLSFQMCVRASFAPRPTGPGLFVVGAETPLGGETTYQNNTLLPVDPASCGLWDVPEIGAAAAVVYQSGDDMMALTYCHRLLRYLWTGVFARGPVVTPSLLDDARRALQASGVPGLDGARVRDPAACAPTT